MVLPNFSTSSSTEMDSIFQNSSVEELKKLIPQLNGIQLIRGMQALENDPQKFLTVVNELSDILLLEAVGRSLSERQFIILLNACKKGDFSLKKFEPLLVGLPFQIFLSGIQKMSDESLESLKKEELLEPLQNHLNIFGHEWEKKLGELELRGEGIAQEIQEIDKNTLTFYRLKEIRQNISFLEKEYLEILETLDKVLAIIWSTSRIDIIDRFSQLKETANLQYIHMMGDKDLSGHGIGLKVLLNKFLNHIFENESPQDNVRALKDDDTAIEGLGKLGLRYLQDYLEAGLLQHENLNKLETEPHPHLYEKAQNHLDKLGIKTVKDLKNKNIYSKEMLKEFVKARF